MSFNRYFGWSDYYNTVSARGRDGGVGPTGSTGPQGPPGPSSVTTGVNLGDGYEEYHDYGSVYAGKDPQNDSIFQFRKLKSNTLQIIENDDDLELEVDNVNIGDGKDIFAGYDQDGTSLFKSLNDTSNIEVSEYYTGEELTFDLSNTGVTGGSYDYASVTVDNKGRLTSASSNTNPLSNLVTNNTIPSYTTGSGNLVDNTNLLYTNENLFVNNGYIQTGEQLNLTGMSSPSYPVSGGALYVDSSDGKLYFKSDGTDSGQSRRVSLDTLGATESLLVTKFESGKGYNYQPLAVGTENQVLSVVSGDVAWANAQDTTYTAGTGLNLTSQEFSLSDTAVTPGSYTSSDLTVDQQGRITAISNGSSGGGGPTYAQFNYTSDIFNDSTVYTFNPDTLSGTSTLNGSYNTTTGVYTASSSGLLMIKTFANMSNLDPDERYVFRMKLNGTIIEENSYYKSPDDGNLRIYFQSNFWIAIATNDEIEIQINYTGTEGYYVSGANVDKSNIMFVEWI